MAQTLLKLMPHWLRSFLQTLLLDLIRNDPQFAQQLFRELQPQRPNPPKTGRSPLIGMISVPPDFASRSEDLIDSDLETRWYDPKLQAIA